MDSRMVLIYFAVKYEGDWNRIYEAIINKEDIDPEEVLKTVESLKSKAVTIVDIDYPKYLTKLSRPPFVIFYYGDFSLMSDFRRNLSVVGARKYTGYGQVVTEKMVTKLCKKYNIVSGMALGIDSIAHKTCIKNKGKTIAVLGSGIDFCYPNINKDLYEDIKKNHLVISEFPGSSEPKSGNFPQRNRIIAGLGKGLLVCEARNGSGSSITAAWALEYNREVMCVPNTIFSDSCCNKWIKDGAYLVESAEDVIEIMDEAQKFENS